ncbi:hypothetical protein PCCS19_29390 [Paenibacillus sp. CCS19]|uniref:hypothetical protein n=1 Tax=Paenibacillus sp. CCS19 TaxID=3158387 RepID=UPI002568BAED|nr:hypothetical protein [Paenibacillus cellulosilyticus]GMK39884.1 hypothetical protein PCCS19_29390 [Paenibacillus cellulosilyticus]
MQSTFHDEVIRMGGYFEDVSERLQSHAFIDLLRELQQQYSEIDMEQDIQWAIDASVEVKGS